MLFARNMQDPVVGCSALQGLEQTVANQKPHCHSLSFNSVCAEPDNEFRYQVRNYIKANDAPVSPKIPEEKKLTLVELAGNTDRCFCQ